MIPCIVIPVLNTYDKLQRCVESIDVPVDNLIVINNGSGVVEIPVRANRQTVLNMPSNLGVGPSWNLGIKCFPWVSGWVILNADAWFEPGALATFAGLFEQDRIVLGGEPGWCCVWVGDKVIEKVGLFPECYVPAYFEDWDFERRAKLYGVEILKSDAKINHDNSSTIKTDVELSQKHMYRFRENNKLYERRWMSEVPDAGLWDIARRRRLGWDAP